MHNTLELNGAPSVETHLTVTGHNQDGCDEVAPVPSARSVPDSLSVSSVSSVVNPPLFLIPDDDRPAFSEIPSVAERTRIQTWLAHFQNIFNSGNVEAACRRIAAAHGHVNGQPGERGYAWRSIQNRYYLYLNGGDKNGVHYGPCDWRTLRDTRRVPDPARSAVADRQVPWKFRQFWQSFRARFQRTGGDAAAHRSLIRLWKTHRAEIDLTINGKTIKAGDEIPFLPGYSDSTIQRFNDSTVGWPSPDPLTDIPPGWSYANLNRIETDQFTTATLKLGRSASYPFRPKVGMTRDGLRYAQLYYFDDQQYDEQVNYLGIARKPMRPWGLDCLEALTACHVANMFKPTIVDDDGTKQRLREVDTVWFIVHVLMTEGYRTDTGTTLAGEHGTATLRDRYADTLARVTGGKVQFDAGGIEGAAIAAGFFEGKGGGNFRHKAPLESIRNLLRNEMSALPGATGKDRDHSPEINSPEKGGQFKYNTQLLRAADALPEEQRKLLRFPFLHWHHFCQLALYFIGIMDRREDHDLKHWHRCGFVLEAWRLDTDQPWLTRDDFLKLPAQQQEIVGALLKARPELTAVKKLSPYAARQMKRKDPAITKLPPALLPDILGLEGPFTRDITVRPDSTIEIQDRDLNPEPMLFHASVPNQFGADDWIPAGTKLLGYLDHIRGVLHLFDAGVVKAHRRGNYIGTCHIYEDAPLANRDALARACGAIAKIEKEFLAPAVRLGNDTAKRNLEMREHNVDLIAAATTGRTPLEHAEETKRVTSAQRTTDQLSDEAQLARELLNQND
jgi:hypothetical protein